MYTRIYISGWWRQTMTGTGVFLSLLLGYSMKQARVFALSLLFFYFPQRKARGRSRRKKTRMRKWCCHCRQTRLRLTKKLFLLAVASFPAHSLAFFLTLPLHSFSRFMFCFFGICIYSFFLSFFTSTTRVSRISSIVKKTEERERARERKTQDQSLI